MDIQHLRYFVEVAKRKNFTRAAEQLMLTQPMITRAIKQIEEELEVRLIERTSKSFRLTDAGEMFYSMAMELLQRHKDLYRCIEDVKSVSVGKIRMSTPGVLLDVYFPPLLMEFRQKFPGVKISIIEEGSKLTAQSVMSDTVDLGLVMLPVRSGSQMDTHVVVRDAIHVVVSRQHPLAHRRSVFIPELKEERIITFSDTATLHDTFIAACENHGFVPDLAYKSLMSNFTMEMVSFGNCVAVLPFPVVARYITPDLVNIPLEPTLPWQIAVISKKDRYQSYAAKQFISFMINYFDRLAEKRRITASSLD